MVTVSTPTRVSLAHTALPRACRGHELWIGLPSHRPHWTVDMLDALPDDGQRYEIIDGIGLAELFGEALDQPEPLRVRSASGLRLRLWLS